jgi:hypothetical protein
MSEDDQAVTIHGRTLIIERFERRISRATRTATASSSVLAWFFGSSLFELVLIPKTEVPPAM